MAEARKGHVKARDQEPFVGGHGKQAAARAHGLCLVVIDIGLPVRALQRQYVVQAGVRPEQHALALALDQIGKEAG